MVDERALPYRPGSASLYTGEDPVTAQAIASHLYTAVNLSDSTAIAAASALFASGFAKVWQMSFYAVSTRATCFWSELTR